jgi:lysophospholipase L1-like esterase
MNRFGVAAAKPRWRLWLATVGVLVAAAVGGWSGVAAAGSGSGAASPAWVGTWSAAQVAAGTSGLSATGFDDQTVRNIVHTSAGGSRVRLRLSNVFGTEPLTVTGVHVGLRSSGAAVAAGTDRAVTFGGAAQVTIPAGQRAVSDPVALTVGAERDLAVSVYFAGPTGPATWHPNADSTNYYADGDHGADTSAAAYTHTSTSWYFLDGVDVLGSEAAGSVVTFGPSTTDGDASTRDANLRYPDDLARRLLELPAGQQLSVLNAGISGNQLLADGGTSGPSALSRFARDALDQTGVRAVVIWEGTNDIGNHPDLDPSQLTDAYQQLIDAAHQQGIRVIGATLQPDKGTGYYTPEGNEVRKAVNDWIRTSGAFDGVADFDQVLLDPADPDQMLPAYDSGDHLHPNDLGYQAIADSINLRLFTGPAGEPVFSGIGTADPASMTVQPGGSATDTITVRSLGGTATLPWDAGVPGGAGITVRPRSGILHVPAGGSATVHLAITVSATAANSTVTFNLRNPTGESALATRFAVNLDRHSPLASSSDGQYVSFANGTGAVVHDWKDTDRWNGPYALGGTACADSPVVSSDDGSFVSFVDVAGNVVHD